MRRLQSPRVLSALASAFLVIGVGCQTTSTSVAPASGQAAYAEPDALVGALADAVKREDRAALRSLFGPRVEKLKTEDSERDAEDFRNFSAQLAEGWKVERIDDYRAELLIGDEAWPFAVPLAGDGAAWWFDTDSGIDELISRRIGRNELKTIDACLTLIDAQRAYQSRDRDADGVPEFAARLMSTEGTRDGLYWPAPGGVDPSPIGPALAMAATRTDARGQFLPFWGYRYRLLTAQAESAPGGAMAYLTSAGLTGGWAVIAYPADYDSTGVMSFMTSHHGVVLERDLGPDGAAVATSMTAFDPEGWTAVFSTP